jgi:protocatechuate 3,4-dioxygenase beta subunit
MRAIDRRKALGLFGVGVGAALAMAACGGFDGGDETSSEGASTTTNTGDTTGGAPATTAVGGAGGAVTADMFAGAASCRITPSETEGPYYIDVDQVRSDIREDRHGTRLRLAARVMDSDGCTPLNDAVFEVWHCDAAGVYSGFEAASRGQGGGRSSPDTTRYLRGAQITNADGIAELTTIYPGWYRGRTVHIHAKVFISNREVLTTQLYFDDKLTDAVYMATPYSARPNRDQRNDSDGIFDERTVLTVSKDGDGYLGLITIGVRR